MWRIFHMILFFIIILRYHLIKLKTCCGGHAEMRCQQKLPQFDVQSSMIDFVTAAMKPMRHRCMLFGCARNQIHSGRVQSTVNLAKMSTSWISRSYYHGYILKQNSEVELFAMMAWGIWTQRNQVRLNHATAFLHQISQISKDKLAE